MTPFTYIYHEKECQGNFVPTDKGYGWYKVFFYEHSAIILRAGMQTRDNKMIWVQNIKHDEPVWPHDLIQVLGECIDRFEEDKNT